MKKLEVEPPTLMAWLMASPVTTGLSPDDIARIAPQVTVKVFAGGEKLGADWRGHD